MDPICAKDIYHSGMGHRNYCKSDGDYSSDIEDAVGTTDAVINTDGSLNLTGLSLSYFRKKLIVHFNIIFKQNKVKWLTSNKKIYNVNLYITIF